MHQVLITVEESKYSLLLKLLKSLDYVKIISEPTHQIKNAPKPTYDFSDLSGKLQWKGDAVAEQQMLRNEW